MSTATQIELLTGRCRSDPKTGNSKNLSLERRAVNQVAKATDRARRFIAPQEFGLTASFHFMEMDGRKIEEQLNGSGRHKKDGQNN